MSAEPVIDGIYEIHDDRFRECVETVELLETIAGGCRWSEGPVYFPAHRSLLWSDIPNDRVLRYDEIEGRVAVLRQPAGFANGHTRDREGRLIACEQGPRHVVRTEHDGSRTVLAARYGPHRLNSPNDVVVASDGAVWFTDPTYGIDSDYEGHRATSEIGRSNLYRIDPSTGACELRGDDFSQPNGLAFSPTGDMLYVVDSGATHAPGGPRNIRRFTVDASTSLTGGEVIAECTEGVFDGLRTDEDGRLWVAAGDGVRCFLPDGTHLGTILVPEITANVEFGGPRGNALYICATTSLYRVLLRIRGARSAPREA